MWTIATYQKTHNLSRFSLVWGLEATWWSIWHSGNEPDELFQYLWQQLCFIYYYYYYYYYFKLMELHLLPASLLCLLIISTFNCIHGMWGSGAEGKLAGMTQKLCLLTAIANLSHNSVSGTSSIESLAATVVDMFISLLQSEGLCSESQWLSYSRLCGLQGGVSTEGKLANQTKLSERRRVQLS